MTARFLYCLAFLTAGIGCQTKFIRPASFETRVNTIPKTATPTLSVAVLPMLTGQIRDTCQILETNLRLRRLDTEQQTNISNNIAMCRARRLTDRELQPLANQAASSLREILFTSGNIRLVADALGTVKPDVLITTHVSEFLWDASILTLEVDAPLLTGSLVLSSITPYAAASAPFLGPLGGLLSVFDHVTGIPMKGDDGEIKGGLSVDFRCLRRDNTIISSFSIPASFSQAFDEVGDDTLGSYAYSAARSTPADALREIAKIALPRIQQQCFAQL